jgi:apolipoprotein N-acyltransferase
MFASRGRPTRTPSRAAPFTLELLLAAAFGALQTIAFVHTEAWLLQLVAVALLAWRVRLARPRRAFALGWVFGTAWMVAGTWWLFISMHRYGGLPAWMAALAVLALGAFLSLYLGAACGFASRWQSGRAGRDALAFAALWLLAELARGVIFTGFPWVVSGYAQVDAPLARLAPWVGVYGIGFVLAALAAWTAFGLAATPRHLAGAAVTLAALVLLALLPPTRFSRGHGTLGVALLQGNVPQDEKFETEHQAAALQWHLDMLFAAGTDLVVAPETAVPFLPQQMPEDVWPSLQQHFTRGRTHALFGVPLGNEDAGYTNSAVGFGQGQPEYHYSKHHLVPFGEFIPTGFRWFTQLMNIPLGDFNRGALAQPPFVVNGERIAPNICYEDLFGEEIAAGFADPAKAPTILVNLSNIGWFGDTIAVDQHLQISRMRTLEFERPMLRATNTGATAVIDYRGAVRYWLPPHTRGVLTGAVEGRDGLTPFAWWASRFGLWPPAVVAGLIVIVVARRSRP